MFLYAQRGKWLETALGRQSWEAERLGSSQIQCTCICISVIWAIHQLTPCGVAQERQRKREKEGDEEDMEESQRFNNDHLDEEVSAEISSVKASSSSLVLKPPGT